MNVLMPSIKLRRSTAILALSALLVLSDFSGFLQQLSINMRSLNAAQSLLAHPRPAPISSRIHEPQSEPQLPAAAEHSLNNLTEAQAQGIFYSGMKLLAQGSDDLAARELFQAVGCSTGKRCNFIHLQLGEIWAQRGLFTQADSQWQILNAPEYFTARAEQALADGELELSWLYFQNAGRSLLEDPSPRMGSELAASLRAGLQHLGANFQDQTDYQNAQKGYQLCLQLFPTFVPCRLEASRVYAGLGLHEQAQAVLEEAIASVDSSANPQGAALLYMELARLQFEYPDEASAIRTLQAAQAAGLQDGELAVQLGVYLRQAGNLELAVEQFLFAGENAEPGLKQKAQRQLAYTLIQLGQLDRAANIFLAWVNDGSARADDLIALARLSLHLGSIDEACRYYSMAQALPGDSSLTLTTDLELQAKCPNQP